ncbi:MAG TPA: O-antigen ligase family protein, partial [Anaerolineales bacterium]|nr:O-antigen ligase family protein [Anaerolineales bacterium]
VTPPLLLRVAVIVLFLGALTGAGLFLSQKEYITRLFNTQSESVADFIIENSAGARAAYTSASWRTFQENPIAGVGLGASGFYIYDHLPDWSLTIVPEIARQLNPENRLYPNPKSMYLRLLAETGLIGFFLFIAFLFSVLGDALRALQSGTAVARYLGIAGIFTWFAVALYNSTQDSFATPNLWINFGILVGMTAFTSPIRVDRSASGDETDGMDRAEESKEQG